MWLAETLPLRQISAAVGSLAGVVREWARGRPDLCFCFSPAVLRISGSLPYTLYRIGH